MTLNSGTYPTPQLEAYWSVLDSSGSPVTTGGVWHSGSAGAGSVVLMSWDSATGAGLAELTMFIDMEASNGTLYPRLPTGGCTIDIQMGALDVIHSDGTSAPTNVLWGGSLGFQTTLPALLPVITQQSFVPGRVFALHIYRASPPSIAETVTVEVLGNQSMTLLQDPLLTNPWSESLLAGNDNMIMQFKVGASPGPFLFRVTDALGSVYDTQVLTVLDDYPIAVGLDGIVFAATESGSAGNAPIPQARSQSAAVADKYCRPARSAGPNGDKMLNCTGSWVAGLSGSAPNVSPKGMLNGPLNPDCGSASKTYFYPTKCTGNKGLCEFGPNVPFNASEMAYQGNETIEVGSMSVEIGVSANGTTPAKWLVGGVEVGATVTGTVEVKVYKTCCKFSFTGGSLPVTSQPGCN